MEVPVDFGQSSNDLEVIRGWVEIVDSEGSKLAEARARVCAGEDESSKPWVDRIGEFMDLGRGQESHLGAIVGR